MVTDEEIIRNTWTAYWRSQAQIIEPWDALSEVILSCLEREIGGFSGRRVLEAGCGTGRISRRMAVSGADVCLLDISEEALATARRNFGPDLPATFVLGSILCLPEIGSFDVVWNAGVLEHFVEEDQKRIVFELQQRIRLGGKLIILTPYSYSIPYRLAKWYLELRRRWPYGREVPEASLQHLVPGKIIREYTIAFLPFLLDAHKFVRALRSLGILVSQTLVAVLGRTGFARLDRWLSWIFGGYLLVTVIERDGEN